MYILLSPDNKNEAYRDNKQNDFDWADEYQGCPDYAEYMEDWN